MPFSYDYKAMRIFLKVKYGMGGIPASYVKLITMNKHIHIPKPCHENWNAMLPEEQGRHCLKCCKTVVDFTNWEVEEIKGYLETNARQKVCGRFRKDQLMAAAFVVTFGLAAASCNDVKGKIQKPQVPGKGALVIDTVTTTGAPMLMGDTILTEDCKKKVE
jgi:hypothetical protein